MAGGLSGLDLMRRAAEGAAAIAIEMIGPSGRVVVICGPGKNGGDGYLVAALLAGRGLDVAVAALGPVPVGDAAFARAAWKGSVAEPAEIDLAAADLVVDALFGIGLARDLDGDAADLVARINGGGRPVLALDLPSGVDADTGAIRGIAVKATVTAAFACRKPGHLLQPGRARCGTTRVVPIGVDVDSPFGVNGPGAFAAAWPRLDEGGHKYDRGHALVLSGPPHGTGAARLAARAALRAGAGLVTVVTSARALSVNAAHLTAVMLKVCDEPDELADLLTDDRFNAVALGPGLGVGETTRRWVEAVLEADRATVLDADALTSFANDAAGLAALVGPDREAPVVLTPHDGEFARLFGGEAGRPVREAGSKLDRALAAAALTGAVTVLKGPDTVVASPDGRAVVNANGTPHLGTAGTGDVLAGIAAGLLARGMPGFEAACAAVWIHAEAARRFGPGLISEDLPDLLPGVLREIEDA